MADPATSGLGGLGGQFWSTLLGAVVGAITSGAVSLGLQIFSAKATRAAEKALRDERREVGEAARKERSLEKRQRDLLLAHAITFKLLAMSNSLAHIEDVVKEARNQIGPFRNPNSWLLFTPIGNRFPQQMLERDEQSFIASLKVSGLTSKVVECFYLYNDFIFLLESYKTQRSDVLHRVAAGRIGKMNLGSDPNLGELQTYEPLIIPVRQLADALLDRTPQEFAMIQRSLRAVTSRCEALFGEDFGKLSDTPISTDTNF